MNSVKLSLLCAVAALMSACSTPFCNAPGGLCAPGSSNTSVAPAALPPPAPAPLPKPPPEPTPPPAETFAVTLPGMAPTAPPRAGAGLTVTPDQGPVRMAEAPAAGSAAPIRMALLLPLRSETLGLAASSVRAGFLAAWERDRDNITVDVIETGDVAQDVLASYARAQQQGRHHRRPAGALAVAAIAASPLVQKPTVALNYPDGHGLPGAAPLPPQMLAMGLSIEEEARQAAQWAAADQPGNSALILSTGTPWQRRVAAAFAAQWQRHGLPSKTIELSAPDGYLSDPELVQLRARLRDDPPGLLFSAMSADQTRQLRGALGDGYSTEPTNPIFSTADALPPPPPAATPAPSLRGLPIYGTSALNPGSGSNSPTQELDGVRLLDLPWQLQRDHPAVMVYPHPLQSNSADIERLYALGIDAYRVAREIGRHPAGRFQLDGVTGRLSVEFGDGAASFERTEQPAVYQNGVARPVTP
ncbi:penicillin-binding protein activator [Duganella sp. BJB1802]|uniref:penicillin-binding protein activator n=1 Tax=Duganella sp. BJB1802 TaxID=2744575 RepID=UPI001594A97E|nr:penicillin-binding protein activator [Duganella sp. BJB1802]NVD71440.1 penicillin-binding protein activator [Duganella sp. BJB1802]